MGCSSSWPHSSTGYRVQLCFNFILGHSTVSSKCRLHLWVNSEYFFHFHYFQLNFNHPLHAETCPFFGLLYSSDFIHPIYHYCWLYVPCILHKITFHIVLGEPQPILVISVNIFLWFIYSLIFKIVNYLNISLVGVPYFSVGASIGYVTYYYFNYCKDRSFVFNIT